MFMHNKVSFLKVIASMVLMGVSMQGFALGLCPSGSEKPKRCSDWIQDKTNISGGSLAFCDGAQAKCNCDPPARENFPDTKLTCDKLGLSNSIGGRNSTDCSIQLKKEQSQNTILADNLTSCRDRDYEVACANYCNGLVWQAWTSEPIVCCEAVIQSTTTPDLKIETNPVASPSSSSSPTNNGQPSSPSKLKTRSR